MFARIFSSDVFAKYSGVFSANLVALVKSVTQRFFAISYNSGFVDQSFSPFSYHSFFSVFLSFLACSIRFLNLSTAIFAHHLLSIILSTLR